jgi:exonuclease III
MAGITTYLSTVTLYVNRLNSPIKRFASWIKKQDQKLCCLQEMHCTDKNKHWLRVENDFPNKWTLKTEVAILIK